MCLCVFAKSTMDTRNALLVIFFACAFVQLDGGVGSGSGSAIGHHGFSLIPSFSFEPAG